MRRNGVKSLCPLCRQPCPELIAGPREIFHQALSLKSQRLYKECFEKFHSLLDLDPEGYGVDARLQLASLYREGKGCEQNFGMAFDLCRQSHERGNTLATLMLGSLYLAGEGCERNFKAAFNLCTEAYEKGDARATVALAHHYRCGFGCKPDPVRAFNLYTEAHEKGDTRGTVWLAKIYRDRQGALAGVSGAALDQPGRTLGPD